MGETATGEWRTGPSDKFPAILGLGFRVFASVRVLVEFKSVLICSLNCNGPGFKLGSGFTFRTVADPGSFGYTSYFWTPTKVKARPNHSRSTDYPLKRNILIPDLDSV